MDLSANRKTEMITLRTDCHDSCGEPSTKQVEPITYRWYQELAVINSQMAEAMEKQDLRLVPQSTSRRAASLRENLIRAGWSKWDVRTTWIADIT